MLLCFLAVEDWGGGMMHGAAQLRSHGFGFDQSLFRGNKKPASLQVQGVLCLYKILLRQWISCFSEFEGTLNNATKDAKLCAVVLGFEKVISIFTHGAGKEEG